MGYSTDFEGVIKIEPALNQEEITYLNAFFDTRHMQRTGGPYVIGESEEDVTEYNQPPEEQPGLWCNLWINEEGTEMQWSQCEKTYDLGEWVAYVIEHFIKPDCIAKQRHPDECAFFTGHTCNGILEASGEEAGDIWGIIVQNNTVGINEVDITPCDNLDILNPETANLTVDS